MSTHHMIPFFLASSWESENPTSDSLVCQLFLDWSHHVDSTKLPRRSIFMKVELLLTYSLMGTNHHHRALKPQPLTQQSFGTFSWSQSSFCVGFLGWGRSHGLVWCLHSWARISGWMVRPRGCLRVTGGERNRKKWNANVKESWRDVRERLGGLVKSAGCHVVDMFVAVPHFSLCLCT